MAASIASTASRNAASLALDGLVKPLTLRTYWNAAARISPSFTGGSKLKRVLMFLHMSNLSIVQWSYFSGGFSPNVIVCVKYRINT